MEEYHKIIVQLDPEDQKIVNSRIQEGAMKFINNMKYLKPEVRERFAKRMQKLAKKQQELTKEITKK